MRQSGRPSDSRRGRAPDRAAQFWLRLVARRGGLCACGLWRPMRRSSELRRHFRLQRSEERPSAGAGLRGGCRGAFDSQVVAGGGRVHIDLSAQTIVAGNLVVSFAIDPVWKTQLLNGWDDVDSHWRSKPASTASAPKTPQRAPGRRRGSEITPPACPTTRADFRGAPSGDRRPKPLRSRSAN